MTATGYGEELLRWERTEDGRARDRLSQRKEESTNDNHVKHTRENSRTRCGTKLLWPDFHSDDVIEWRLTASYLTSPFLPLHTHTHTHTRTHTLTHPPSFPLPFLTTSQSYRSRPIFLFFLKWIYRSQPMQLIAFFCLFGLVGFLFVFYLFFYFYIYFFLINLISWLGLIKK